MFNHPFVLFLAIIHPFVAIFASQEQRVANPKVIVESLDAIRGFSPENSVLSNAQIANYIGNPPTFRTVKLIMGSIKSLSKNVSYIHNLFEQDKDGNEIDSILGALKEVKKINDVDIQGIGFLCEKLRNSNNSEKVKKINNFDTIIKLDQLVNSFFAQKGVPVIIGVPGLNMVTEEDRAIYRAYLHQIYPQYKSPIFVSHSPDLSEGVMPDLGQKFCQEYLEKSIIPLIDQLECKRLNVIFHGWSQGTATTLNYIAKLSYNKDKDSFTMGNKEISIKAIVLEAPLATPLSAILHVVKNGGRNNGLVSSLSGLIQFIHQPLSPLSLWAKGLHYATQICDIEGQKPLESIQKIPTTVPIIIAHSEDDPETDFNGSKALYHARVKALLKGENNTYFIPFVGCRHGFLFLNDSLPNIIIKQISEDKFQEYEKELTIKKNEDLESIKSIFFKHGNKEESTAQKPIEYYQKRVGRFEEYNKKIVKRLIQFRKFLNKAQESRRILSYYNEDDFKFAWNTQNENIYFNSPSNPNENPKITNMDLHYLSITTKKEQSHFLDLLPPTCSDNKKAEDLKSFCKEYGFQPDFLTFKKQYEVIGSRERVIDVTDSWGESLLKWSSIFRVLRWFNQPSESLTTTKEQSNDIEGEK